MFAVILPILKSKLAVLGAVIIVCLLIAFGGPRVIGVQYKYYCWLLAALILVGYLIYLGISKWRAKRNARMLEGFLNQQADDQMVAQPDVQDELEAIKKKLNSAMRTLKSSRMAKGRRGAEALYVLPWYMIIGPSASGKSTAIRNSGLHFPPVDPDSDDPGKIKGMGGTRNCDWWFSNEGIILDTAGRYTLSQNVQEDREEWLSFLDMLRKARPRAPINGLILSISMDELLQKDADQLDAHARALRARVDELIMRLGIMFPIYVVFTKCDLVSGFVESFSDLSKVDREQVWGFTRASKPVTPDFGAEFAHEFDLLQDTLERRRITNLEKQTQPARKRGVYMFPVELGAAREHLTQFIESLFRPNPYQQNPIVRGVYFTSGTQEGTPIAQVIGAMSREFGLPGDQYHQGEAVQETKAYFIRDLFQEIILADETMVMPTSSAYRRRRWLRGLAMVGQLVATGLLTLLLVFAYRQNVSRNQKFAKLAVDVINETKAAERPGFHWNLVETLDELRDGLVAREKHTPLLAQMGVYSGHIVESAARQAFFERFHNMVLLPTKQTFESQLGTNVDCDNDTLFKTHYSTYIAYQMLSKPFDAAPTNTSTLKNRILSSLVTDSIPDDDRTDVRFALEDQINYYWTHRADTTIHPLVIEPNSRIMEMAAEENQRCMNPLVLYRTMIEDINGEVDEFRYSNATRSSRLSGDPVPGAYTLTGWEDHFRKQVDTIGSRRQQDPVLKESLAEYSDEHLQELLVQYYMSDFKSAWKNFLSSGDVTAYMDIHDASDILAELATDPSPLNEVLEAAFENSQIRDRDGKPFRDIENDFRPLGEYLGKIGEDEGGQAKKTYLDVLEALSGECLGIEEKLKSGPNCAKNLRQFNQKVTTSQTKVRREIRGQGIAEIAANLLNKPISQAWGAATKGACECIERQWKSQVYEEYELNLANQYPFSKTSASSASMSQLVSFFGKVNSFKKAEIDDAGDLHIPMAPEFETALRVADQCLRVLNRGTAKLQFNLHASATAMDGVESFVLTHGAQSEAWEYVMGPPKTQPFKWPPKGGQHASLIVRGLSGGYYEPLQFDGGDWCIFRLLDEANYEGDGVYAWMLKSSTTGAPPITVRLSLTGSDQAFILAGHFTTFQCPEDVCR